MPFTIEIDGPNFINDLHRHHYLHSVQERAEAAGFGPSVSRPVPGLVRGIAGHLGLEGPSLDVGCGAGYDCPWLPGDVVGLDRSSERLRIGRPQIDYPVIGDARYLPFRYGIFGCIWSKGLSLFNTWDVGVPRFWVHEYLFHLSEGGRAVVSWSTNLSGVRIRNWIHHTFEDFGEWFPRSRRFFVYGVWPWFRLGERWAGFVRWLGRRGYLFLVVDR
jgi:hypothetical protein